MLPSPPLLTRYAQTRLFNRSVLCSPEAIKSFSEAVEEDKELRNRSNRKADGPSNSKPALARLCSTCEAVEEVWLNGLSNVDFAAFPRAKSQ